MKGFRNKEETLTHMDDCSAFICTFLYDNKSKQIGGIYNEYSI